SHDLARGITRTEGIVGVAPHTLISAGKEAKRRGDLAERIIHKGCPTLYPRMKGKAPREGQQITPLCQELEQGSIGTEQLMRAAQIKGVAGPASGTYPVVVAIIGKAKARQQES